jgi:DNA-binding MurR/RpiR family transcriptional regulator
MPQKSPTNLQDLKHIIAADHTKLSKRLKQVAKYLLDYPDKIAFGTVSIIATDAGVHPSTLVRFANNFGYSGFSEMQQLFQQHLLHDSPSYTERIRKARESSGESDESTFGLLDQFARSSSESLEHLVSEIDPAVLEQAVTLMSNANNLYIVGVRRAFSVAAYLSYALRHAERNAFLIDGVGGLIMEQASNIKPNDALIAISFHPYAEETQAVVQKASEQGADVLLLTDSELSPVASQATMSFVLREAEVHGIRSLSSSMCLAQALAVGLIQVQ